MHAAQFSEAARNFLRRACDSPPRQNGNTYYEVALKDINPKTNTMLVEYLGAPPLLFWATQPSRAAVVGVLVRRPSAVCAE